MTEKSAPPPDQLRCKRTDGRQWRCKRLAMEGKTLCDIHRNKAKGMHSQHNRKAPQHLKLERRVAFKKKKDKVEKQKGGGNKSGVDKVVCKKDVRVSEELDEALKRMRLKRGDLHLDLIRVFLKRQVDKKKERDSVKVANVSAVGDNEDEIKMLPYGVMAISKSKLVGSGQIEILDVKLGVESNGDSCLIRSFRSKNPDPMPVGAMQVVPFADVMREKKIKCHLCEGNDNRSLIKCLTCRKRSFCMSCIKERFLKKQEVKLKCPACRGKCSCNICLKQQRGNRSLKDCSSGGRTVERMHMLHYLVYLLLPVLKMLNSVKSKLETEAKLTGKKQYEIQTAEMKTGFYTALFCGRCKASIVDCHRTCENCSYNLCLSCCKELSNHSASEGFEQKNCKKRKMHSSADELTVEQDCLKKNSESMPCSSQNWETGEDGTIPCPPEDIGGCGDGLLDLRCIFPSTWTRDLEIRAEEILTNYNFPGIADMSSCCTLCNKTDAKHIEVKMQREPCRGTIASSLYCPTLKALHQEKHLHFQNHWGKGHPVIVRNLLRSTNNLCWDPVTMFCLYVEGKSSGSCSEKEHTNCLDWCEVQIDRKRIQMGSIEKRKQASMQRKTLKFKAWLSSRLFQKHFPLHYSQILSSLPLQEYVNPVFGVLNVCTKFPKRLQKPDLGPCISFSYGGPEELMQADFLSNLSYESHDLVNILTYATDAPISTEQISKIENLMKKYKRRRNSDRQSCSNNSNSCDQKDKSSLQSDTGQSSLEDTEGKMHLPNGIEEMHSYIRRTVSNGNVLDDGVSDADESPLYCGSVENSEDTDEHFREEEENLCSREDGRRTGSCGAIWDIFPRQYVPELLEYIRRHSNELRSAPRYSKNVHPILDQSFFLDAYHMLKLKEEFDIQPWTFEQCPGEAIFVPAGCPYQIRNLKSCVNVVLDFLSPENAAHCIQLNEEIRLLPTWLKSKKKVLEVEKMAVHGISSAIQDICSL